jgi:hypothetical protein
MMVYGWFQGYTPQTNTPSSDNDETINYYKDALHHTPVQSLYHNNTLLLSHYVKVATKRTRYNPVFLTAENKINIRPQIQCKSSMKLTSSQGAGKEGVATGAG